jgi:hypothetical protein
MTQNKIKNKGLLLEAFKFNWEKIKHDEIQRMQIIYFNIVIITAFLSIIRFLEFPYILFPLYIISFQSYLFYRIILKLNVEIAACVTTLQWISERLGLIREMTLEEKENLKKKA